MATYRAVFSDTVIAESDHTVVVDGYRYFPEAAVHREFLVDSTHLSVCGWKGQASYYDVVVDGARADEAAWYYADPKSAADMVRGHIGFWRGAKVERSRDAEGDAAPRSAMTRLSRRLAG